MKYGEMIGITRVQDGSAATGTYYSDVPGMPENVPYNKLRNAIMQSLRVWMPEEHELRFRDCGARAYAYVDTAA